MRRGEPKTMILDKHMIRIDVEAETPEEAIHAAGTLLLEAGKIEERYIEAMIKGFKDFGPYIVLAPSIAIPHARPEHGVIQQGMAIVRLKKPVVFGHPTNDPVQLVCAICGVDNTSHIGMLQAVSSVLGDKARLKTIMDSSDVNEILSLLF